MFKGRGSTYPRVAQGVYFERFRTWSLVATSLTCVSFSKQRNVSELTIQVSNEIASCSLSYLQDTLVEQVVAAF